MGPSSGSLEFVVAAAVEWIGGCALGTPGEEDGRRGKRCAHGLILCPALSLGSRRRSALSNRALFFYFMDVKY